MDQKRYDLTNILITGDSGDIGKLICSILKKEKIIFLRLSNFDKKNKFKLENSKLVNKLSKNIKPSLIIHCAIDSKKKPNIIKNIKMIKNLIKYFNVPIIYISSVSVYTDLKKGNLSENLKKYKLNSKYALVKRKCEEVLLSRDLKKDLCLRIPGLFSNSRKDGIMFNLKKKFKNKNFNFNFFDLDKQWQCIHEKHFEFYFIKILRMQSIDFKILNVGYKGKVSISRAIEIINNRLPSRNKIFLRGKSTTTELNLNRLMKITKKKFYTLKDGVNLLLR